MKFYSFYTFRLCLIKYRNVAKYLNFFFFLLLVFGVKLSKEDRPPADYQIEILMGIKESLDENNTILSSWEKNK